MRSARHKRERAEVLVRRLKRTSAARCAAAYRAGQVVSGRAACRAGRWGSYWRKDGVPVWQRPESLLAEAEQDYGHSVDRRAALRRNPGAASRAADALCATGVRRRARALLQEAELPVNLDTRRRLDTRQTPCCAATSPTNCRAASNTPTGYVLPLAWRRHANSAGTAHRGKPGATACISPRATRRWACACRWPRCRGWRRTSASPGSRSTPLRAQPPLADFHGEVAARYQSRQRIDDDARASRDASADTAPAR